MGQQALFYHSNTKPPGIVDIVKEAYVDHTQFCELLNFLYFASTSSKGIKLYPFRFAPFCLCCHGSLTWTP